MNNYKKERHKIISKAISELYTHKEIAKIFAKAKLTLKNSTNGDQVNYVKFKPPF